jgi:hypothetical protein
VPALKVLVARASSVIVGTIVLGVAPGLFDSSAVEVDIPVDEGVIAVERYGCRSGRPDRT